MTTPRRFTTLFLAVALALAAPVVGWAEPAEPAGASDGRGAGATPASTPKPTNDEERYADRENSSGAVADFQGGDAVVITSGAIVVVLLIVILIVLL
jgi:hypothetical protein